MTTLAIDKQRKYEIGDLDDIPAIASDIIYEGAAVGIVDASGHARPLVAGDKFGGFCMEKCDNSAGAAAAKRVNVQFRGVARVPITDAVVTDRNVPVYATDDDTFSFNPVGGSFVGMCKKVETAGYAHVHFDVYNMVDPFERYTFRETIAATKTLDAEDTGKLFAVTLDADADQITIPAVATGIADVMFYFCSAFGTTAGLFDTDNADGIIVADIAAGDGKTLTLTKATQRRGDFLHIIGAEADAYLAKRRGTFVREA